MSAERTQFRSHDSRREFLEKAGTVAGLLALGLNNPSCRNSSNTDTAKKNTRQTIRIEHVDLTVEREPLIRPFGFKGGYVSELWQTASLMGSEYGLEFIGLGTQSVLWSDSSVFASNTETDGNRLMLAVTERALDIVDGNSFTDPIGLLDTIFDEI